VKRHVMKFAALTTMVSLGLTAAYVLAGPVAAQGKGTCIEGATKIDNPGDFEVITAPAGSVITAVAIKAGTECFVFPPLTSNDCYSVSGLGTSTVTIERIGSGPACKEISHIEFSTGPGEQPPPPPPPPPPTTTVTTTT
jgi:hypothetical protein